MLSQEFVKFLDSVKEAEIQAWIVKEGRLPRSMPNECPVDDFNRHQMEFSYARWIQGRGYRHLVPLKYVNVDLSEMEEVV